MHWIAAIGLAVVLIPVVLLLFAIDVVLYMIGIAVLVVLGGVAWLLLGSETLGLLAVLAVGFLLLKRYGRDLVSVATGMIYRTGSGRGADEGPKDPEARLRWANREGEFADNKRPD
jgi:hypothetical protein